MFVIAVLIQNTQQRWRVKLLPVLDKGTKGKEIVHYILGDYLLNYYQQVWLTSVAIPISQIDTNTNNVHQLTTSQLKKYMKKCEKEWSMKWECVHSLVGSQYHDYKFVDEAIHLWQLSIKHSLEGRLLHIYEIQKVMLSRSISLTLEVLYFYLLIWCWFDLIEMMNGVQRSITSKRSIFKPFSKGMKCRRCLNQRIKHEQHTCYSCGNNCMYCDACVQLGKVKSCSMLLRVITKSPILQTEHLKDEELLDYLEPYKLSPAQTDAVLIILRHIVNTYGSKQSVMKNKFSLVSHLFHSQPGINYLIWAVTGAGKTEMIFPLIRFFLEYHKKVLIVIPRRDVVQELQPRITTAFPSYKVTALYGGSKEVWDAADIYIATTHQAIRFDCFFDLVILDEMDAFPYYNNEMLIRTLKRVQREQACFIQLTATVPKKEKLLMKLRKQDYVKVPVRFHRKPLPVPTFIKTSDLMSILQRKLLPEACLDVVKKSINRGAVLFVFLQRKSYLEPFTQLLQSAFPNVEIDYTSAEDMNREEKVKRFRLREIQVLVTTSILERGVTIKKSDICIMDAHQRAFTRPAIVQMAGRAGRSIDDPNGNVYLLGTGTTSEIKGAIKEIKGMNSLAKRKGYLEEE